MVDVESPIHAPTPIRPHWVALVVAIAVAVAAGWRLVSVNRVDVTFSHPSGVAPVLVELAEPEPLLVTVAPSRRTDGTEVFVDGLPVAHPPGPQDGQLLVGLDGLEPGVHEIKVRVPRPTWVAATVTIEVEIQSGPRRR